MTREIKFRAWHQNRKKMFQVLCMFLGEKQTVQLADFKENQVIVCNNTNDEVLVMQYTGLKDKNGKEIYEGDVVSVTAGDKAFAGQIGFYAGTFTHGKDPLWGGKYSWTPLIDLLKHDFDGEYAERMEVIGNIYENPELV